MAGHLAQRQFAARLADRTKLKQKRPILRGWSLLRFAGYARRVGGGAGNIGVSAGIVVGLGFAGIEGDFPVGETHEIKSGGFAGEVVGMTFFEAKHLRIIARLADGSGIVEDALEGFPGEGVAQIGIKGDVYASLGPAGGAAGAIEENHVPIEVGVVVNRRTPMRIGVSALPGAHSGKDGAELAAETGFGPLSRVEFIYLSRGGEAVFKGHAGGGYALRNGWPGVVSEEEIEELLFAVEDHTCVAMTAGKEAVLSVAIDGIAGFENDAEIVHGGSVIAGDCGTDFGSGETVARAAVFRLVVVEEEEGAVLIAPDGFKPDRAVFGGIEDDFAGFAKIELVGATADVWDASGMEEVHGASGPESGTVAIDYRWEFDAGSWREDGTLGEGRRGKDQNEE